MFRKIGFSIAAMLFLSVALNGQRIVFLGDSLTAGYRLDPELAYPQLVENALQEQGIDATVVNAGLSGDTTAGGVRRIDWILRQPMDILVIALGANDALRGFPVESTKDNLELIIEKARAKDPDLRIILAGMLAPPNMGMDYRRQFDRIYPEIAESMSVELMPFLLKGVAGDPSLNLADGTHPNARGQRVIAAHMLEVLDLSTAE